MVKIRTTPSSSSENNYNNSNKKKKAAVVVNKGAWSAEEDKKLVDYVNTHGDKKWRSLPVDAGLNRCGKSCRLRWLNYLRPGIKRGNISEDEEDLIIRLHNLLGNRWSLIAGRLPGRTDNEIKNHWNTHLSKKSLTIDELNLKLNQKLESNTNTHTTSIVQTTSSNIPVTPDVDWAGTSQSNDTFKRSYENGMLSKPTDGFLNDDLDINGFFDFSVDSDLPISYPFVGSSESRLPVDYNPLGDEIYHKFLDSELYMHGSSIGNLDEQFNSKLDIERLLYSDDDNMFLSFS